MAGKSNEYSLTSLLHDSWNVGNFFIAINGVQMPMQNLLTYETVFHGHTVLGVMSFSSEEDVTQRTSLTVGAVIDVTFISQPGSTYLSEAKYTAKFAVTSFKKSHDFGDQIYEIQFEDLDISKLKTSFRSFSYNQKTKSEIFKEITDSLHLNVPFLIAPRENETPVSLLTPSNISLYDYLKNEMKYAGYSFVIDKNSRYIVHETLKAENLAQSTGEIFLYKPRQEYSRGQVLKYNIDGFNMDALIKSFPSQSTDINDASTFDDEMDVSVKTIQNQSSASIIGQSAQSLQQARMNGIKQSGGTMDKADAETLTKDLKRLQSMSIWVPGWNGNRIGMKVQVEVPNPKFVTQNSEDATLSGNWIVYGVRDKIISGTYFVQELFLSRSGELS